MSFRLARRKLRPLEWIQKCWMHFYCFLVKGITKWAEMFTGWFYYISLDSCKVWKHLQTLYQCCAWALKKPSAQARGACILNWFCTRACTFLLWELMAIVIDLRSPVTTNYANHYWTNLSWQLNGAWQTITCLNWIYPKLNLNYCSTFIFDCSTRQ